MKLKIIPERCIACGLCHSYAPDVFDYNDDGIVKLYTPDQNQNDTMTTAESPEINQAIKECPTRAITRSEEI